MRHEELFASICISTFLWELLAVLAVGSTGNQPNCARTDDDCARRYKSASGEMSYRSGPAARGEGWVGQPQSRPDGSPPSPPAPNYRMFPSDILARTADRPGWCTMCRRRPAASSQARDPRVGNVCYGVRSGADFSRRFGSACLSNGVHVWLGGSYPPPRDTGGRRTACPAYALLSPGDAATGHSAPCRVTDQAGDPDQTGTTATGSGRHKRGKSARDTAPAGWGTPTPGDGPGSSFGIAVPA